MMKQSRKWNIFVHGDRCLVVQFGTGIDVEVGRRCGAAAVALQAAALPGVSDIVPTFNMVAVHFLPAGFKPGTNVPDLVSEIHRVLSATPLNGSTSAGNVIELPICYGGEYGPDLADVAERTQLSPEEVIQLHGQEPAYVFMLGFAPGAPFMGVHDERFALPRRSTPRTSIPAGSVGIANRQTFIYPNSLPGGWHIIGRTPLTLFDPARDPATLISPGDTVQFVPISEDEFKRLAQP